MITVDASILKEVFRERAKWSHKGDFGKLLVIGGSKIYTGSPALAAYGAMAALRTGVDLVTVAAPERAADMAAKYSPNLITVPFDGDFFRHEHLKKALELAKGFDAVVIGTGMGLEKETQKFIAGFVDRVKKPCVIDADGIKAIKGSFSDKFLLTPHAYEFFHMTGDKPKYDVMGRAELVRKHARKIGATILLKGAVDIISDGRETAMNKTGNTFMTVGGTGDVLTGICGALMAQKIPPFKAGCAGAYLSGYAGDLAAKEKRPLLATDIIEKIPQVLMEVLPEPESKDVKAEPAEATVVKGETKDIKEAAAEKEKTEDKKEDKEAPAVKKEAAKKKRNQASEFARSVAKISVKSIRKYTASRPKAKK
ncbi:MAG: NAD(P)H-hydrate dehydratase [Candidatus Aenigmatarchaeota archaeon]